MMSSKESTSSKVLDESEKTNYWNDSTIQYNSAAVDKWRKKKWKTWKCWREVGGERKDKKNCWKKILDEEKKFWYNDILSRRS